MKRFLLIIGSLLVLIFVALLVLPRLFKDDIKSAIEQELDNSLNAKAYFDENSFSVSVFKNFPNLTVTLNEFGLAGKGVFEGDTLIDVQSMGLEIDLMKLLKGEVTLTGLSLDHPKIFILRLAEGPANYDIVKESEEANTEETAPEEETEGEPMVIAIDHWKITEGTFLYYDTKYNMFMDLEGLNLTGGGDLISSRFDLATELEIARTGFVYDEVTYLSGQSVKGEVVLDMNYSDYTFTFKQNTLYLNDFGLHFDGYFGMPDEGYEMDLTFASEESTFKSLLSLIPAFYSESFADLQADGKVQFDGSVKGLYSFEDDGLPAFRVNMRVDEGNFRYPDLPTAMEAVNLHMIVDNPDGVMDHTRIDLETIDLTLGTTGKVAGSASVRGLTHPDITANLNGSLNLGALAKALPPEVLSGIDMAGDFSFGVNAAGVYNQEQGSIPKFRVNMALKDGRMQYADYPIPMEQIAMQMNASNQSGRLEDTEILLDRLHMRLDGEEMLVKGSLRDLNDYTWKVSAVGGMDLAKIAKVANLEGMTLAGRLEMDLTTEGKYSALQAERYDQLPTSGTLSVANFRYESEDVPMPVAVPVARLEFNPRSAMVKQLDVLLGESDLHLSGTVTNYLSYILEENAVLQGDFNFTSKKLDLNELMGSDEEAVADADTAEEDTTSSSMEVVVVPKNLDLRLNSQLTKVYYDNLEMDNMRGEILVRNGQVELNGLKFGMLDGNFAVSGTYDTRNPDDPQVDLDLDVEEVSLRKAYDASGMVRRIAPVAQNMTGKFSTEFSIHTGLQQDMMPDYSTLTGAGLIAIAKAAMDSGPIVSRCFSA